MRGAQRGVEAALAYASLGLKVFPVWGIADDGISCACGDLKCDNVAKHPAVGKGFRAATTDAGMIHTWWAGKESSFNIGISMVGSGLVALDVDARHGGLESLVRLKADLGEDLPSTLTARTGGQDGSGRRGFHLLYKVAGVWEPETKTKANLVADGYEGIDVRYQAYIVVPPSLHQSGNTYEWTVRGGPAVEQAVQAPGRLLELIRARDASFSAGGAGAGPGGFGSGFDSDGNSVDLDELLEKGIPEGGRNNTLYRVGCVMANRFAKSGKLGSFEEGYVIQAVRGVNNKFCQPPVDDDEAIGCARRAIEFVKDHPIEKKLADQNRELLSLGAGIGSATVAPSEPVRGKTAEEKATEAAGRGETAASGMPRAAAGNGGLGDDIDFIDKGDEDFVARSLTDVGNGRRLADYWGKEVQHSFELDSWLVWDNDNNRWLKSFAPAQERAKVVTSLIVRESLLPSVTDPGPYHEWALMSKNSGRLSAAMNQWKTIDGVDCSASEWDSKPELLACANGVVDLRTGRLIREEPDHKLLLRSPAVWEAWNPWSIERWTSFIRFACKGDEQYMNWLQMAAGYTLTGYNDLDTFFIPYGPKGSGKSTFMEPLAYVLGDMAMTVDRDLFVSSGGGAAARQLEYYYAQMPGKRLGMMSEWPESGGRIREDAIKQLTGGSQISARHPAGKPFMFHTVMKLWLDTNHKPAIMDDAMWRRIRVVPFDNVPADSMRSNIKAWALGQTGDVSGPSTVLGWAVAGAVKFLEAQRTGTVDPVDPSRCDRVRTATLEYQGEEDRLGLFIAEVLEAAPGYELQGKAVWDEYGFWMEERGEKAGTRIQFDKRLREREKMEYLGSGRSAVLKGWKLRAQNGQWGSSDDAGIAAWLNR